MHNKKRLLILAAVLAGLLVVYIISNLYISHRQEEEDAETAAELTVTDIDTDSVTAISYSQEDSAMSFSKTDDTWYCDDDKELPLKQDYITDLLDDICDITAARTLDEPDSLDDYGLEEPSYEINVTCDDGSVFTIEYGDIASDSNRYITADGGQSVFVADDSLLDSLEFHTSSLIQTEDFPEINSTNIASVKIVIDGETIAQCSDDDEDLSTYGTELSYISLTTCVSYNASDSDLKEYGLTGSKARKITAEYEDSDSGSTDTVTFIMSETFEENDETYAYIQLEDSDMVYEMNVYGLEKLLE